MFNVETYQNSQNFAASQKTIKSFQRRDVSITPKKWTICNCCVSKISSFWDAAMIWLKQDYAFLYYNSVTISLIRLYMVPQNYNLNHPFVKYLQRKCLGFIWFHQISLVISVVVFSYLEDIIDIQRPLLETDFCLMHIQRLRHLCLYITKHLYLGSSSRLEYLSEIHSLR